MLRDFFQHRINNCDWPDGWVFEDQRLNLMRGDDEIFLKFLCETIHPVVRTDQEEVKNLLKIYNSNLEADGFEIFQIKTISSKPVFSARLITTPIQIGNLDRFDYDFVKEQHKKCDDKLYSGDYDGAITSSRSLVEGVISEIYHKCTGKKLLGTGDLLKDYKAIKDLINLSDDSYIHDGLKSIVNSFNGIIQNIDFLSNKMGDRHRPIIKPSKHHAKLVVDSAKTISDFLFSSMEYHANRKNTFINELLSELDSDKRFLSKNDLLNDNSIKKLYDSSDVYLRNLTKEEILKSFKINSYRQSDIFFALLRFFFKELTVNDIEHIYIESQTNNQIVGWNDFQQLLSEENQNLLQSALENIYKEK
ncbi:hypothetical protein A2477_01415 [Candidatus Falkowbacteria bacterium RIFOXYC2_FULL_47_12]|uniref:Abortive infection protein-like C-terminal domain-containing protein n=1 Tax=Candidatus Falkowbacteria bacterium RIFOXYC2_FULL_47_12 TaxID=1798004 RepID=A0A1F5TS06_9BACT|nr:MAG: hypothetical protein A2477_01415 [Candidatus Falkowbacteria bacterium RIFOXYC2_FULL_47_12]